MPLVPRPLASPSRDPTSPSIALVLVWAACLVGLCGCTFLVEEGKEQRCRDPGECAGEAQCIEGRCVPPAPDSCVSHCGEARAGCYCDVACLQAGDCCADFEPVCGGSDDAASCQGRCGDVAPIGCLCDPGCVQEGDCCPDYEDVCVALDGGPADGGPADGGPADGGPADGGAVPDAGDPCVVPSPPVSTRQEAESLDLGESGAVDGEWVKFGPPGGLSAAFQLAPGRHVFRVRTYAEQAGTELARMRVTIGDVYDAEHEVEAVEASPEVQSWTVELATGGATAFGVEFVNDYFNANETPRDRNLMFDYLEVETVLECPAGILDDQVVDGG